MSRKCSFCSNDKLRSSRSARFSGPAFAEEAVRIRETGRSPALYGLSKIHEIKDFGIS